MTAHYVYRVYASGDLIYVGCTKNLKARLRAHGYDSWWAPQATKVIAKVYPDRGRGRAAESEAIRQELPAWNTRGKDRLTDGWVPRHFATYGAKVLADGHTPQRLLEAHQLANIFRREFGDEPFPVDIPAFELANPYERRVWHTFEAERLATDGWLIKCQGEICNVTEPGDQNHTWIISDFNPAPIPAGEAAS